LAQLVQAIRGMNDILPEKMPHWHWVEAKLRAIIKSYAYQEIRLPIVEATELFKRSIGEVTDIVEKEMYTFEDRNGDSLSLRPEGTAGCVRAGLEHGLLYNQVQRLWYMGPMFRHERPQKGRYRQFYQLGVEAYGIESADIDAELILMTARFWQALGIADQVQLQINSLGTVATRNSHREHLLAYFNRHQSQLDEDSQRRLKTNPLRILDSKNPNMQALIAEAPQLLQHLDEDSKNHFAALCALLDAAGIRYQINPALVRGLDYYSRTVFEWVTENLGAQGTVCAGGRYDGLVEQLGGKSAPAIGFALGLERLVSLCETALAEQALQSYADVYMIIVGEQAGQQSLLIAEKLRDQLPKLRIYCHCGSGSFKSQFKRADKSGAKIALILGDEEMAAGNISVKFLREDKPQQSIAIAEVAKLLTKEML